MRFAFIVCTLLGVFQPNYTGAVVFKFTNFECLSYNESWFQFQNCRLKAVSRDRVILNMYGTIIHVAHKIQVHIKLLKKANGFKPWLVDEKVDVCRYMQTKYNPIAKIVFNLFQEFSNVNHTCPYMGLQVIKGFYLKPELLLLPFPTGEYMLMLKWFFDQKHQFDTNVTFVFVEDLINS